jgi:hypothetical protein
MADPKTSGPDPLRLLEDAEAAIKRCEEHLPDVAPFDDYNAAAAAMLKATPHLPLPTAGELEARFEALPSPTLLA